MNHNIINYPTIPTEIVVHLGSPTEAAKNISISFIDYIKNNSIISLYAKMNSKINYYSSSSYIL